MSRAVAFIITALMQSVEIELEISVNLDDREGQPAARRLHFDDISLFSAKQLTTKRGLIRNETLRGVRLS
jgi:hypothetical protein